MKRKVFRIVFFSAVGGVFLLTLLSFIFQDRIISAAAERIRSSIRTRITIGDASFSLVRNFPYASIRLYDVSILSTKDIHKADFRKVVQPDTLLEAKTLNIKLNLIDLIRDKITIKQLTMKGGELNLLIDKKGRNNYQIFKKSAHKDKSELLLKIRTIRIEKTKFRFINMNKQIAVVNSINYLKSNGHFSLKKFNIKSKADIVVNQLAFGKISYISNRQLVLEGKIKSSAYKSFGFKDFTVTYKSNIFNIDGGFSTEDKFFVNASVVGTDLALKEMNELVPKINDKLAKVNFEGKVNVNAKARGFWTSQHIPFVYGEFEVRGGKSELLTDRSVASVNMKGAFSNGKGHINNAYIRLESFKVYTNFGDFEGKFTLTNFNKPMVSLSSNFNLFISQLNDAYHIDSTKQIDGTILGNITANGLVNFDSLSPLKLIRLVSNGNFKLSEVSFPINGSRYYIPKGEISFIPTLTKASISFTSNAINGHIYASVTDLYDGLLSSKPLTADITANTKEINFDNLLMLNFNKSKSAKGKDLNLVNLKLNVKSKSAVLRGVKMNDLEAVIEKIGPTITFSQLKANAFDGKITMVGKLEPNAQKGIGVDLYAQVDSINIEKMFASFKDFGQKSITSKNIRGIATGDIAFRGQHVAGGALDSKSIDCVANITINNGQLIAFEPAYKLSKFIDLKELENIRFATLSNQITIRDGVISIPAMYIASSAINLGVTGTHAFDGAYSYRVKLALKDMLFKKARSGLKRQVSQQEFDNNMLLYFKIDGDKKTSKVSYDWSGKSHFASDVEAASNAVKKAESTNEEVKKQAPQKNFKLQWDGEDVKPLHKTTTPTQPNTPSPKTEKKKEPTTKEEEKPKFKVVWDE